MVWTIFIGLSTLLEFQLRNTEYFVQEKVLVLYIYLCLFSYFWTLSKIIGPKPFKYLNDHSEHSFFSIPLRSLPWLLQRIRIRNSTSILCRPVMLKCSKKTQNESRKTVIRQSYILMVKVKFSYVPNKGDKLSACDDKWVSIFLVFYLLTSLCDEMLKTM